MSDDAEHHAEMMQIAAELTDLVYRGQAEAVGLVIITKGNHYARTMSRAKHSFRFHLIAGCAHLQYDLLHAGEPVDAPQPDE